MAVWIFLACGFSAGVCRAEEEPSIYGRENLAAWCVVPFDASQRGPVERARMLSELGFTKLAYDWRAEHVPSFEAEIQALQDQDIDLFAFWSPMSMNDGYKSMMALLAKYELTPQIWMIPPAQSAPTQEARVEKNARAMLPFVRQAAELGCKFALYNHGGWAGEPDNLIALTKWLRMHEKTADVGIVYSFHHGHEHLSQFPAAFQRMVPYLHCVNLNGMTAGGPKILPLGAGREDVRVLGMIRDVGYRGPIGILDHRSDMDARQSLQENLDGLQKVLKEMGDENALRSFSS
jgi:sugar phosphate isomerase/epimerase